MRHARHIDDHAVLVLEHMRQHRLHGVKRAVDVECEGLRDERVIDLEKLGPPDRRARGIEKKMHRAERGDRAVRHVADFLARGDVGMKRERLAAGVIDGRRGVARALLVDIGADDVRPFASEDQRGSAADAARRAGNEDRLSGEIIRRFWHGLLLPLARADCARSPRLRQSAGNSAAGETTMPRTPIEYRDASAQVRAVFDDIKRTRQVDDVNNFWKYLAHDPALLARTWASVKEVMAPGALRSFDQGDGLSCGERHQWLQLLHRQPYGCGAQSRNERSDVRRADGGRRHGERDQSAGEWLSRADRPGV